MAVIRNYPKSFTEKQKSIPKGALLVMKSLPYTAKVTKLDMAYSRWIPDMTELFGQKVDVRGHFYVWNTSETLVTVRFNNENYIIPEDWCTEEKVERKTTTYKHKLICVSADKSIYFTAGKVYLFDKGVLFDDTYEAWNEDLSDNCALTYAQNVEDINKYFHDISIDVKFIEYVE